MIRKRMIVTGRVQNMFFRAWLAEQAQAPGVDGWARKRADGSVEAVVDGATESVDAIVAPAHDGPPSARVEQAEVTDEARDEALEGFENRPTG